jgi:hypothetical protein
MTKYEWKARGGSKGIIEADNLLDLIKQVNLVLMNKHSYYLDEFTSIEEMQSTMISVCEDCKSQNWTMEDEDGEVITNSMDKEAYCFECNDFCNVIETQEKN